MFSFQERMKTFEKWPENYGVATPACLSIAGFTCVSAEEGNLTVRCVYCSKTLESWESTDLPAREHYLHMTKCPLFNVNLIASRMALFRGWEGDARPLCRLGFVKYNLGASDFIFCYKCGSVDRGHACRRSLGARYDAEKQTDVFFYSLIEGAYEREVGRYLEVNVFIPGQLKEQVRMLVGQMSVMGSTEDAVKAYVDRQLCEIEKVLDDDIRRTLEEVFAVPAE